MSNETKKLRPIKAIFIGREPIGELMEDEKGIDAIQVPLKKSVLRTKGLTELVELKVEDDSTLCVRFMNSANQSNDAQLHKNMLIPIELIAYAEAVKQLPFEMVCHREFEKLLRVPMSANSPPVFSIILRNYDNQNAWFCYSFLLKKDDHALELSKRIAKN
jgi:hypothetical protein